MDYGHDSLFLTVIVDRVGRRFWFDDRLLPPAAQAARRTAVRQAVSDYARRMFTKQATGGLPAGNLMDVVADAQGWRNI